MAKLYVPGRVTILDTSITVHVPAADAGMLPIGRVAMAGAVDQVISDSVQDPTIGYRRPPLSLSSVTYRRSFTVVAGSVFTVKVM